LLRPQRHLRAGSEAIETMRRTRTHVEFNRDARLRRRLGGGDVLFPKDIEFAYFGINPRQAGELAQAGGSSDRRDVVRPSSSPSRALHPVKLPS